MNKSQSERITEVSNPFLPIDIQVPVHEEVLAIFGPIAGLESIDGNITFQVQQFSKSAKKALGNLLPERAKMPTHATINREKVLTNLYNQMETIKIALESNFENYQNPNLNYHQIDPEDKTVWIVSFHIRDNGDLSKLYMNSEDQAQTFEVVLTSEGELRPTLHKNQSEGIQPWHDTAVEGNTKIEALKN